ncbi:MAG: DegT/DnrJ/EryC1/StrS aminotransferase family protein [Pseudomonadota bacterium]
MSIPFIDLQAQRRRLGPNLDAAILEAVHSGQWILGPLVRQFEEQLAAFCGAKYALGCANGTDAVALPLMAWGVGAGDAVFCPSFTFAATAEVVPWTNATPVFVDITAGTYGIDPMHLERTIEATKREGKLTPKAIIAVDLFGQPADYPAIAAIAKRHGLKLIADSAQGFGCTLDGRHPMHWADAVTTSFFPAKPLGCYGDGGAVLTNSEEDLAVMRSFAVHGGGDDKYDNVRIGMNSRLDSIQAAILLQKLAVFADEIVMRNEAADRYASGLKGHVLQAATVIEGGRSTWAQYTIEHEDRDGLAAALKAAGVPTAIYYPRPLHRQTAYQAFPTGPGGLPNTDAAADVVISLPMHADLDAATQNVIIEAVAAFGKGQYKAARSA